MYKIFETVDEVSRYTAQRLRDKIQAKPEAVLGLATGGTMEPVYARLVQMLQQSLPMGSDPTLGSDPAPRGV